VDAARAELGDLSVLVNNAGAISRAPAEETAAADWDAILALNLTAPFLLSQAFARDLLDTGSNGVVYQSVRHEGGECIACFRPKLVKRVRVAAHYEYVWEGKPEPRVRRLAHG
jgi:NAD(P)-dependent dehydrogenase (short-subunit alcohol dehydrogenase family)